MNIEYEIATEKARKKFNFYRTLTTLIRGIDAYYEFLKKGELKRVIKAIEEEDTITLRLISELKVIESVQARIEKKKGKKK